MIRFFTVSRLALNTNLIIEIGCSHFFQDARESGHPELKLTGLLPASTAL
jgi:hypothetical protein